MKKIRKCINRYFEAQTALIESIKTAIKNNGGSVDLSKSPMTILDRRGIVKITRAAMIGNNIILFGNYAEPPFKETLKYFSTNDMVGLAMALEENGYDG